MERRRGDPESDACEPLVGTGLRRSRSVELEARVTRDSRGNPHTLGEFKQVVLMLRWLVDSTRLAQLARDNGHLAPTIYRHLHEGLRGRGLHHRGRVEGRPQGVPAQRRDATHPGRPPFHRARRHPSGPGTLPRCRPPARLMLIKHYCAPDRESAHKTQPPPAASRPKAMCAPLCWRHPRWAGPPGSTSAARRLPADRSCRQRSTGRPASQSACPR